MRFSEKLKKLRFDNGVTQQQLAEALGKTNRFISYYENEEGALLPPMDVLTKIANFFQIPVVDLIPDLNVGTPKINIEQLREDVDKMTALLKEINQLIEWWMKR